MKRPGLLIPVLLILLGLTIFGAILMFSQGNMAMALAVLAWYPIPTFVWCFLKEYDRYYLEQLHLYQKRQRFEIWLSQLTFEEEE
jgi:hypothetical protein